MTPSLSTLRSLAEAATPGPWVATESYVWTAKSDGSIDVPLTHGYECELYPQDAAFIAACSPEVILALIELAEKVPALIGELEGLRKATR